MQVAEEEEEEDEGLCWNWRRIPAAPSDAIGFYALSVPFIPLDRRRRIFVSVSLPSWCAVSEFTKSPPPNPSVIN